MALRQDIFRVGGRRCLTVLLSRQVASGRPIQPGLRKDGFMIFIVVKFTVRPEYADEWVDRVRNFTEATQQEPGNLWFEWSRSVDNPNQFVLLEAFRDGEAGIAHVGSKHFKTAIQELPLWLDGIPEIVNVDVPGTEWSRLAEMAVPDA
jgi:quinol monooxygenase YgiN